VALDEDHLPRGQRLCEEQVVSRIRIMLLNIGAVIIRNTRRISFSLPNSFSYKNIFRRVASVFASG